MQAEGEWGSSTLRGGRLMVAMVLASLALASAAEARTLVTLTFDDGSSDQYAVRPMLAEHGMRATFYVNSGQVGTSSYYMGWSQLDELYADGHEIGGHTLDHTEPGTQSADEQRADVCQDRANLLGRGFAATSFAYVFGTSNITQAVLQGCGYNSGQVTGGLRWGSGCLRCPLAETLPPEAPYFVRSAEIRSGDTGRQLAGYVADAEAAGGGWVVFPFNRVCDGCSRYGISAAELHDFLGRIKAMVATGDVQVGTVQQVLGGQLQPVPGGGPAGVTPPRPQAGSGISVVGRDTLRPIVVRLSVSPRRFALAPGRTALTAAVRRGTMLRYTLSEPARVRFRVQRAAAGRRVGRSCRRPTVRRRGARRCTRYLTVGSFSRTNPQLTNRVRFTGRIGARALRIGRHRIAAQAVDRAGNRSRTRAVDFTVVPGRTR